MKQRRTRWLKAYHDHLNPEYVVDIMRFMVNLWILVIVTALAVYHIEGDPSGAHELLGVIKEIAIAALLVAYLGPLLPAYLDLRGEPA